MNRQAATEKGLEKRLRDARFAQVNDPRRAASVTHPLPVILTSKVTAVATGARSLRQFEQRTVQLANKHGEWNGVKGRIADNTLSTLLPRLFLPDLMASLHRMVKAEHRRGNLKPTHPPVGRVAIDGKHVATLHWHDLSRLLKAEQDEDAGEERIEPTAENLSRLRALLAEHYPEAQLCIPEVCEPHVKLRVHTVTLISSAATVGAPSWVNRAGWIGRTPGNSCGSSASPKIRSPALAVWATATTS